MATIAVSATRVQKGDLGAGTRTGAAPIRGLLEDRPDDRLLVRRAVDRTDFVRNARPARAIRIGTPEIRKRWDALKTRQGRVEDHGPPLFQAERRGSERPGRA